MLNDMGGKGRGKGKGNTLPQCPKGMRNMSKEALRQECLTPGITIPGACTRPEMIMMINNYVTEFQPLHSSAFNIPWFELCQRMVARGFRMPLQCAWPDSELCGGEINEAQQHRRIQNYLADPAASSINPKEINPKKRKKNELRYADLQQQQQQ